MKKHNRDLVHYVTVLCIENIRKYILSYAIVLGIALGIYRLLAFYGHFVITVANVPQNSFQSIFPVFKFFLTFIFTWNVSNIFHAMHDQRRATMFYTLPVSSTNKFWGMCLFSLVGGMLLFLLAIMLFVLLANFISGISGTLLEEIEFRAVLKWMASLMFAHAMFFLGAVFFTRRQFLYTIGMLTIIFVLFVVLLIRSIYSFTRTSLFDTLQNVPLSLWYCIGAIVCWTFAYVCYKRSTLR